MSLHFGVRQDRDPTLRFDAARHSETVIRRRGSASGVNPRLQEQWSFLARAADRGSGNLGLASSDRTSVTNTVERWMQRIISAPTPLVEAHMGFRV